MPLLEPELERIEEVELIARLAGRNGQSGMTAALLMAAILYLVLGSDPGMGSRIWAFLLAPLTIGIIFSAVGVSYLRRGRDPQSHEESEVEEPLPPDDLAGYRRLRREVGIDSVHADRDFLTGSMNSKIWRDHRDIRIVAQSGQRRVRPAQVQLHTPDKSAMLRHVPISQRLVRPSRGEQRGADVDIEGADILVAGGRGLGKAEGFEQLETLAGAFGGNSAVAATRAVVDAGWYPYAAQIGQTGKTVAPKLYLAAGISGAIQHKVGMQSSENIVAINKDANAPIFEFSDLGIVGDLNKIVPKLTEAVKAKKGG